MGIVHRDLKLENVMMTDKTDNAIPVIVDFGLSIILGPGQRAYESSGTVGYCAPEVLQDIGYSFQCDMWSYGCIVHALLTGCLPFDSPHKNELIRMTVHDPLKFIHQAWF